MRSIAILGAVTIVGLMLAVPLNNANAGVAPLVVVPDTLQPGESTNITYTNPLTVPNPMVRIIVLEPDGSKCAVTVGNPEFPIMPGEMVETTYPDDYNLSPIVPGDGQCDTNDAGEYMVKVIAGEPGVGSDANGFSAMVNTQDIIQLVFQVSFNVLPESAIGVIALVGAIGGTIGAFVLRRNRLQIK